MQLFRIGRFAQASLGDPFAARIVKKDSILVAGPHGIVAKQARAENLKKQATRLSLACDQGLMEGGLVRVKVVVLAKSSMYMFTKLRQCRERSYVAHRG
jgi:hypothetical protein